MYIQFLTIYNSNVFTFSKKPLVFLFLLSKGSTVQKVAIGDWM